MRTGKGFARPTVPTSKEEGLTDLRLFLRELHRLKAVLLLGNAAQQAWNKLAWPHPFETFSAYHPSNLVLNRDPTHRDKIAATLTSASGFLRNDRDAPKIKQTSTR